MDVTIQSESGDERDVRTAEDKDIDPGEVPWWTSCRLRLVFVSFLGIVNLYALRVNMSVAIVCMVNQTAVRAQMADDVNVSERTTDDTCRARVADNNMKDGPFIWNKHLQGIILGSFFWGYILTQILGGWLAGRFGGKKIFGYFMLMTAIATLLTPVAAKGSPYLLMFLRFLEGIGEGVVFPAMHSVWSKWAPPKERSKLIGWSYGGAQFGNIITLPLAGLLCEKGFSGGWPSVFYVMGMFGIVWFMLWMFVAYDSPAQHPKISRIERRYIETGIGATRHAPVKNIPFMLMAKSLPIWAIIVGHTCVNWGSYTLLTNIPTYMREVLGFDMKSNGLFSSIPYIMFWAEIVLGGIVADKLISKTGRTKVIRKIMNSIGMLLPAAFLIGTGYVSCANPYIGVATLAVAVGFSGFQYSGFVVNHVDIAPPFAGILCGLSNTVATLPGFLAPYAIGRITKDQTQQQWQTVFYVAGAIYTVGAIFYNIFAEGEVLDWVKPYMYDLDNNRDTNQERVDTTDIALDESENEDQPNVTENNLSQNNESTDM